MFKEETVFILGAGASIPYGYPSGKELIKQIIKNIENDQIYLPILSNNNYYWNKNDGIEKDGKLIKGYDFNDFRGHYNDIDHKVFRDGQKLKPTVQGTSAKFSIDNINYMEIKLNQVNEFFDLKKALMDFDPVSIDSFLRDHPSYDQAGIIMIIYSLLKCEDKNKFSLEKTKSPGDEKNEYPDNWYSYLLNDILSGCNEPKDILQNKLKIITFNYSVDLDYCIYKKLSEIEVLKTENIDSEFINKLQESIHHVYGNLYSDNIKNVYGQFFQDPKKADTDLNMQRFLKSVQSKGQIKLIQSDRQAEQSIYVDLIKNAKEIIVIGFGFDRGNLNILGFPNNLEEYSEFLEGKKFKYMDYNGQMNSLHDQFCAAEKKAGNFVFTRSIAVKIIHAYQNDFKIYLYQ